MNTLDSYVLKDILLLCPDSITLDTVERIRRSVASCITHMGMTNKYYYDFVMSDNVLRGLYKYPPHRESTLKNVLDHFNVNNREKIIYDHSIFVDFYYPTSAASCQQISYSEIYAITSNNEEYLSYLQNKKVCLEQYTCTELYRCIALHTNNVRVVDNFYKPKTLDKYILAKMACASRYQIDSLRYVLSLIDTPYVTYKPYNYDITNIYNDVQISCDDCNVIGMYTKIIACGNIDCAQLVYNSLPRGYITKMFKYENETDKILDNIKYVRSVGYIFTNDEFDNASKHDNIETLKYLVSINYHITDDRLEKWKKNPKCKEYLENEMLR